MEHPKLFVTLWEVLHWAAIGALVGAAENMFSFFWPAALAFVAVAIRFFVAPVAIDIYAYGAAAIFASLAALVSSVFALNGAVLDTLLLIKGHRWALSLLALCYGVLGGLLVGVVGSRMSGRSSATETSDRFAKMDRTTFGTLTSRKTHPVLIGIAIIGALICVGLIRGWWS